ncbi:MAG: hypothetical protein HQL45_04055 [Alphaproteobacteria bacterium]|nr:hypothetical protein [Alphaproteobacteria bacterium]
MKQVLRHIAAKKRAYDQLPLFEWMRDQGLTPRARLAFYPCMAPFILSFGDLNKFVLREERPGDLLQDMVNTHTLEDDHHWPWYLEDFGKLGFDALLRGTEWMKFLWGEETLQNRVLMARLTAWIWGTTGLERLVIIEAIEETGNVLFSTMLPLAKAVEREIGEELRFCGTFHFNMESGHTVGANHQALANITLHSQEQGRCFRLVDDVFNAFEAWTHALLRYAQAHPTSTHPGVEP